MAWSAPMSAVANTAFTAAQFNQFVRDNLLETAPAKATTAGGLFVATGANAIAERQVAVDSVLADESTTSTSFTDLATMGPSVTIESGEKVLIIVTSLDTNDQNNSTIMSYEVSGATSISPSGRRGLRNQGDNFMQASWVLLHDDFTPGSNTITAKYQVLAGEGTFRNRHLMVLPL